MSAADRMVDDAFVTAMGERHVRFTIPDMDQLLAGVLAKNYEPESTGTKCPASERGLPRWTYPHPDSLLTLACIEFDAPEFSRQNKLQFAASIEMVFFQIERYSWLKFQCRCNAT